MAERVEIYRDKRGEYRWRRVAGNERQVAESGEGYIRKIDAVRMAKQLNEGLPVFEIEVEPVAGQEEERE